MRTLYISDLDGTLLNADGEISDYTKEALSRLIAAGVDFSVATARSPITALSILSDLNLKLPSVLMNGVMITDVERSKHIDVRFIESSAAAEVFKIFENYGRTPLTYRLYGFDIALEYVSEGSEYERAFIEQRKKFYRKFYKVDRLVPSDNLVYINCVDKYEILKPIYDEIKTLPDVIPEFYSNSYDDSYFMEVFSDNAGKDKGVDRLKKLYGFDRVVAFGDNFNDISMLRSADVAAVMENAPDEVKAVADVIIGRNTDNGVAKYILKQYNK